MIVVPPLNFALVKDGIYRSGYPNKKNLEFLLKLKLTSILYLSDDDVDQDYKQAFSDKKLYHVRMQAAKEPLELSEELMTLALKIVLDVRNHPILIHCNKGKLTHGHLLGLILVV
jgi:tyrosine-protein phosphatase SIW14